MRVVRVSGRLLVIVCFLATSVRAEEPAAPPVAQAAPAAPAQPAPPVAQPSAPEAPVAQPSAPVAQPSAPEAPPAPAPAPGGELNFNLFDEKPKLTAAEEAAKARREADIARKVVLRRKLLVTHQALGFTTLGLLAVTLVLGTLNYVDKYGGGSDSGSYYWWHTSFAGIATTSFALTGILALAAPNPYPKPRRFDTAMLHKIMMGLATAGFVAEAILGPVTAAREGHLDQRAFALAHLVVGYGTFAFMGAGTLAFVFK